MSLYSAARASLRVFAVRRAQQGVEKRSPGVVARVVRDGGLNHLNGMVFISPFTRSGE
jgi:peptide deformylase